MNERERERGTNVNNDSILVHPPTEIPFLAMNGNEPISTKPSVNIQVLC